MPRLLGEPAFPTMRSDVGGVEGMTLRDYFAARAMAAIISKSPFMSNPEDYEAYTKTALGAYDYADAMLEARDNAKKG